MKTALSTTGNDTRGAVFPQVLGDEFHRLHPELQKRFGVSTDAGYAMVGTGVMTRIRHGRWWTVPFLQIGKLRNILVADVGTDVPFTIENYPYIDPHGRETVTFVREYRIPGKTRSSRFDATMVTDPHRNVVVDYLGTHQHLAVDLDLTVETGGSLRLRSDAQRFYEGPIAFRFPMVFSGRADLRESWDPDAEVFRISLEVTNHFFGFLFGYEGWFRATYPPVETAPNRLKPRRHERRL